VPTDLPTLNWLGLRDIPRWYREKYNIPSLLYRGNVRPQLAIANSPTPPALLPSVSTTDEGTSNNKSHTANTNGNGNGNGDGNGRLGRSPPRGPSNRGMSNAHHYGQYRGGYRNGAAGSWKNTHRNGRHPATSMTPNSASSERSGDQSLCTEKPSTLFPEVSNTSALFGTNFSDDMNTAVTPFTTATFGTAPIAPVSPMAHQAATNMSLLDDGNSRNRIWDWRVDNLTDVEKDVFEHAPTKPVEPAWRTLRSRQMHEHSSNPSSDGGVLLPKEFALPPTPMNDPFGRVDVGSGQLTTTRGSPSNMNASESPGVPFLGTLSLEDNVPLTSNDLRATWGPIGGPILRGNTPPADENSRPFSTFPSRPHTN
jgi:hypothetical protein